MTKFLISFPGVAMSHIPPEDFPAVGEAARAVVREAKEAGVYVFSGGLDEDVDPVLVAGNGAVTAGTHPQTAEFTGGLTVVDVASRDEALSEDRDRVPLRAGGARVHVRPADLAPARSPLNHSPGRVPCGRVVTVSSH